jgi:ABC-type protease/lipase transport system fused ATPase/permease subunit
VLTAPLSSLCVCMRSVSQRIHTIADSDRIMVLSEGNIAEFDKPSVLLQTPGSHYRALVMESNSGHSGSTPSPRASPRGGGD